jgi:glycosyltransferase involved in cell wall biosynthesis
LTQSTVRRLFQQLQRLERDASIESRGEAIPRSGVEWLVWIGGSRADVEPALQLTFETLHQSCRQETVTFLLDGPETRQWEPAATYLPKFPNRREIALPRRTDLPALLYGLGLRDSRASWATFLWPGCRVEPEAILSLQQQADGADLAYGGFSTSLYPFAERARAAWVLGAAAGWHVPPEVLHPVESGWLQMVDCVPMNGCLLSVPFAQRVGLFDVNPLLRCFFWWYATRRIAAAGRLAYAPVSLPPAQWNWDALPFGTQDGFPAELSVRFLSRPPSADPPSAETAVGQIEAFENDLPPPEGRELARGFAAWETRIRPAGSSDPQESATAIPGVVPRQAPFPIRVTVLGGPYEPHHDQLYFFNFFEQVVGQGHVSWKTHLYQTCRPADLEASDLVVFSRPRYVECDDLLEACGRRGIATLVMIDDNWIAAGREYPRYVELFTPGKPAFETFLRCIARADATLVYNEVLEGDLRPLARQVWRLPPNVDTSLFRADGGPERPAGFLAGYAGSPRFEMAPFRALAELARRHADVHLLAMAHNRPPEWNDIPADRVLFVPFCVDYRRYARIIASLRPDVLVAPLDGSRFSASKCPTKFLELSAAGTAGIYSKTKPYTDYVAPGRTGLLVDNTVDAWLEALEELHASPGRRAEIARQAHDEVLGRFDTSRVLPAFLRLLGQLAGRTQPASIPPAARPT